MHGKITKSHGCSLRLGRISERERPYLVTTVTHNRDDRFNDLYCARAVISQIRDQDSAGRCETLAWVLMPDHLHWLFVLKCDDLSSLIGRFKQASSAEVNRLSGSVGQTVWQRGFHDRAVRRGEDIKAMARYIVVNPLRAGLVDNIGEYPHWDATWL